MLMSKEKIGQLFMVGFDGTTVTPDLAAFIKEYKPVLTQLLEQMDKEINALRSGMT